MKRLALLMLVLALAAPAFAQTDTPTATNTPTNTPVTVSTPTAVATLTPIPGPISQILPPITQAKGGIVATDGDIRVTAHSTGNAGAADELIGALRATFVAFGTMTNGSTETTLYIDDTPDGEWAAIGTSPVVDSADSTIYKVGTKSLKLAFAATAVAGDGAQNDITNDDLDSDEHIGFWIYASEPLSGGDLALVTDDTTDDTYYLIPAVPQKRWVWVDLDISDLATTRGDVVDKIRIELTSQGATNHAAFDVYFDAMYKWDAADEEALGVDMVEDGLRSIMVTADAAGSANRPVAKLLYTDFFVAYRTGSDSIVMITDQSANSGWAFVPFK